jgi:SAM-dependent methyltransferase
MDAIQAIKQAYYAKNAPQFDSMHIAPHDEHYKSLEHISNFVKSLGIESVLDIGAGTGRGILYFREHHAEVRAHGIEPSLDMRAHAISKGVSPDLITQARAESLPYPDQSFDAICEFGVVHHVRHPEIAVQEMMRVARCRTATVSARGRSGLDGSNYSCTSLGYGRWWTGLKTAEGAIFMVLVMDCSFPIASTIRCPHSRNGANEFFCCP